MSGESSVMPRRPVIPVVVLAKEWIRVSVGGVEKGLMRCSSEAVKKVTRRWPLGRTAMFSIQVGRGYW